jgi:hypothetical protein
VVLSSVVVRIGGVPSPKGEGRNISEEVNLGFEIEEAGTKFYVRWRSQPVVRLTVEASKFSPADV